MIQYFLLRIENDKWNSSIEKLESTKIQNTLYTNIYYFKDVLNLKYDNNIYFIDKY